MLVSVASRSSFQTAMRIAELNVTCVERAQENAMPASGAVSPLHKEASSPESPPASSFCCGDKAQVRYEAWNKMRYTLRKCWLKRVHFFWPTERPHTYSI